MHVSSWNAIDYNIFMPNPVKNPAFGLPPPGKTLVLRYVGKDGDVFDRLCFSVSPRWPEIPVRLNFMDDKVFAALDLSTVDSEIRSGERLSPIIVWKEGLREFFPDCNQKMLMPLGSLFAKAEQHMGKKAISSDAQAYAVSIRHLTRKDYSRSLRGIKLKRDRAVPIEKKKKISYAVLDLCLLQNWENLIANKRTVEEALNLIAKRFDKTARVLLASRPLSESKRQKLLRCVEKNLVKLSVDADSTFRNYLSDRKITFSFRKYHRTTGHREYRARKLFFTLMFDIARTPEKELDTRKVDVFRELIARSPADPAD